MSLYYLVSCPLIILPSNKHTHQYEKVASKSAILPAASASPLKPATAPILQLPTAPKAAAAPASPGKATGSPMLSGAVGPAVGAAQKPVVAQKDAGAALESSASVAGKPRLAFLVRVVHHGHVINNQTDAAL